ncbi:curli synthesis inhibitor [Phytobacter sp. V91]|uniref:curli synthesis inhibitor n=1 Tax=Phytobacter sp. V91 TaxID=3369425 RepID=UPI003F64543E
MRSGWRVVIISCLLPVQVFATTLRLSNDIDLLVLDGKKVSSSLLRGAESIELENGLHQIVFRVETAINSPTNGSHLFTSVPLIATFNTQYVAQVNFSLPSLSSPKEADRFNATPHIALLDGNATPVPVKLDILEIIARPGGIDYEADTERYNNAGKYASLPKFSSMIADDSTLLSGVSELDMPPAQSQTLTEQRLKYWYQQADPQTRDRFMQWVKQQPPS